MNEVKKRAEKPLETHVSHGFLLILILVGNNSRAKNGFKSTSKPLVLLDFRAKKKLDSQSKL